MAQYRMSLFFESNDAEGWSENYYHQNTSIANAQSVMDTVIIPSRQDFMVGDFRLVEARVSDVSIRGDVMFTGLALPRTGTYSPSSLDTVPLEANVALMAVFLATPPRFARMFLRGLSSDWISGRHRIPNVTLDTALSSFQSNILGNNMQARHRLTPPPHATYSYSNIVHLGTVEVGARKPGRPFGLLRGRR